MLLIELETAQSYETILAASVATVPGAPGGTSTISPGTPSPHAPAHSHASADSSNAAGPVVSSSKNFRGIVDVDATLAKSRLNTIAEEVLSRLASDPTATVRITLEIDAEFPKGAGDNVRRAVSENAKSLKFRVYEWE